MFQLRRIAGVHVDGATTALPENWPSIAAAWRRGEETGLRRRKRKKRSGLVCGVEVEQLELGESERTSRKISQTGTL